MTDFERWDDSQISYCEASGMPVKSFQCWCRQRSLTAKASAAASW